MSEGDTQALYGYETLRGNPPPTDKPIRIISMEYCPFAERARIVAAKHGLDHDIINVDLGNKPAFLFEYSPSGQVPALIHEGHSIFESEIVVEYLEQRFPETATLYPKDPAARAEARQLSTQHGSKIIPAFYKAFGSHKNKDVEGGKSALETLHKNVETWVEGKLGDGPFFGGAEPNVSDILIFPFLNRVEFLNRIIGEDFFPATKFPKSVRYVQAMRDLPYIKEVSPTEENFAKMCASILADQKPLGYNIASKYPIYAGPAKA